MVSFGGPQKKQTSGSLSINKLKNNIIKKCQLKVIQTKESVAVAIKIENEKYL